MRDNYKNLITAIIKKEESIIGKVAITLAKEIKNLKIDEQGRVIDYSGKGKEKIKNLIDTYKKIMGPVALTLAREAAKPILDKTPHLDIPEELAPMKVFLEKL